MIAKLQMPKLGWTMTKGKVIRWLKKEGDTVKKREPVLKIETDKVTLDVESPIDGFLRKIVVEEKNTVPVGKVLALFSESLEEELPEKIEEEIEGIIEETSSSGVSKIPVQKAPIMTERREGRIFASPRARKLAEEQDIDIAYIQGTGPNGRIIERDVQNYIEFQTSNITQTGLEVIDIIPMEGIRKTIADRMLLSKRTAPSVTITMEADTSNLQMYRKMIMAQEDIRISYTDIIVKIVAKCLEKHPIINSTIEGNVIKGIKNINIGVAVATERGLIVPVIKSANEKTIEEISHIAKEKINRTRGGNINFEDVTGGTFTVSNLGMFDVEIFSPIINPPESAILGLGKIIEKPVSINKKLLIKPMMQLSLTHDHRNIDGDVAAKFLRDVKDLIENPMELLPKIEEEIEEKIPPISNADADVIIIGAGPGGHDAAIRASQLGKSVIIIEKDKFGGTCVNRGCIPTKILFKEAELANLIKKSEERDFGVQINDYNISLQRILTRKNNITNLLSEAIERKLSGLEIKLVKGTASFIDKNTIKVIKSDSSNSIFRAPAIFIATGFKISKHSFSNIEDNEILNTDEFLELNKLPSSIVIIGGNYIALEFASILNEMGVQVHIINLEERILIDEDAEIVDMLKQAMEMEDIEIHNNININEINISKNANGKKIIKFSQGNETIEIKSEMILDTIKRKNTLEDLNIKEINIELEGDYIKTDRNMKTNILGIYAIGDINGKYMFSHVATREGIVAAEHFAKFDKRTKMSYHSIPRSYFTFPEVAFVGLSEKQAREKYTNIDVIRYPIAYTAMPRIVEQPEGMIKIIIQKDRRTIVGVGIIGKNATELIAEFSLMVNNKLNIDKISDTLHSHPTFSESIKESIWQIFTS